MKFTKNYHLPQWVEDDLILMEDFNKMNENIENGIDGAKAEAKAGDAELQRQVDAANKKAEAAQSAAGGAYSPSFKPYAAGSYVGTGEEVTVELGFRPSFVIISGLMESKGATSFNNFYVYAGITSGAALQHRIRFTDTGFVAVGDDPAGYTYPNFTLTGRRFDYIAFR